MLMLFRNIEIEVTSDYQYEIIKSWSKSNKSLLLKCSVYNFGPREGKGATSSTPRNETASEYPSRAPSHFSS